jgi:histidyl-tRNA synthetase
MKTNLSTQPYKGSRDFYPEEMRLRTYVFDNWRKVCQRYGYEEYDGPFLESFDIYAAKSGEELVNEQLYSFIDRGDRKVAIRAEMTPTIARMVANKFNELPRPIKWFSIPNLWRYEKPQKGRLREHFQLNVDNFGVDQVTADFEITSLLIDLVKQFGTKKNSFTVKVGNRRFLYDVLKTIDITGDMALKTTKILDKRNKVSPEEFEEMLEETAGLKKAQIEKFSSFINDPTTYLAKLGKESRGAQEVQELISLSKISGNGDYIAYDPTIVRGLGYYTGNVFELFDLAPENTRAMAGGGRYDDLVEAFIGQKLSGVGFGMGDVTFYNFLTNWKLLPAFPGNVDYFVSVWPSEKKEFRQLSLEVSNSLRNKGKNVLTWLESDTKLDKQLKYADKRSVNYAIIIGENELKDKTITVKNLLEKTQKTLPFDKFLKEI